MNSRDRVFALIFAAILFSVTLVSGEFLSRILYTRLTTRTDRWIVAVTQSTTFLRYDGIDKDVEQPRFLPHPYMLYQATPLFKDAAGVQHNSMGYRQPEFDPEKKKGVVRILTLGGSTTYGAGVERPSETWPAQLQTILDAEYPKKKYEVINGGLDSASSPEILSGWIFRYRLLNPDIVILNLGINDIWPVLLTKQYSPEYIYFRRSCSINLPGAIVRNLLKVSYLARVAYAHTFIDHDEVCPMRQVQDKDLYALEEKEQGVTRRVQTTENIGFERNFDELIKLIRADGAKVYVTMEPALKEDQFKAKIKSKNADYGFILGLEHAWLIGQQKNYDTMRGIATKYHVPYLTMKLEDFKFEWFVDWYHLDKNGEKEKALVIENGLQRSGLL
jgi:lysophospholipase L1-like esterase